jgi:F-type H+-transporting ATPase subunit gamma
VAKAKAIIKRRKTVISTRKITKTMQLVATAKYQQMWSRVAGARPYRETLQEIMQDVARASGDMRHPLLERREPAKHVTLLLLTSNRGLAGGFNVNLIKLARAYAAEQRAADATVALHVVGKKGLNYFRFLGESLAGAHANFGDRPEFAQVDALAEGFLADYVAGRTDRVAVVYQKWHTAGSQRPHVEVLLPLAPAEPPAEAAAKPAKAKTASEYIYSPDAATLLGRLLPAYFKTVLYHAFLENVVGEQRARMVAMKNATDSADEMIRNLTRAYNRARQSQITNEISEIMGGVEALK